MIRGSPSTSWTRRSKALRLFFFLAFLTFFFRRLDPLGGGDLCQVGDHGLDVEAGVPDVEFFHEGELPHRLAVVSERR